MLTLNLDDPLTKDTQDSKKKKQKLVKHRRKNWKKTDISEVEEGIEELRQQQRTGGVLSEKKDEELFFIHKEKIPNQLVEEEIQPKKKRLSLEERLQNLKCYKNLQPDASSHPAHVVNEKKKPEENSKRQQRLVERRAKIMNMKTKIKALKNRKETVKENTVVVTDFKKKKVIKKVVSRPEDRKSVLIEAEFEKDIWNPSDAPVINEINEYYLRSTKKLIPKRPENSVKHTTQVPKIEVPHPGASYNPDYDEHQELLLKAHLIELEKLKKEEKEMRKFSTTVKKMSWSEIEKVWLEEMAVESLFNNEEVQPDEEEIEEPETLTRKNKKIKDKNESKSKRKRRQLLEKLKLKQKENEKQQRIQQNEIYRLKALKKELNDEEDKKKEERLKKETEEKHKELFMPRRLGSMKFEEPEIELKLSNEITGNLRSLKPEGNILLDRYKSFQKRNIIEPREKAKSQRKYWKKKFEKKNAYEKTYYIK